MMCCDGRKNYVAWLADKSVVQCNQNFPVVANTRKWCKDILLVVQGLFTSTL